MPTLEEAASSFARDLTTMNLPGLMAVFTPEGMMKAMALQGQMLAQAQAAAPGMPVATPGALPAPPAAAAPPAAYTLHVEPAEGEDHPVQVTLSSGQGEAVIRTLWREIEGLWKVNDLALVALTPAQPDAGQAAGSA